MSVRGWVKERERKEWGNNKKGITTLGSCGDDNRCCILWPTLFAHVSFITRSPPLVTPLGDLYGKSSRKFLISAQVPVGARCLGGSLRGSQAPSSNELFYDLWPYLGKAHQKCRAVHPPIRPPHPALPCSFFAVCCCSACPSLRVGTMLPAQDSCLKGCPRAEAAILPQRLRP